MKLEFKNVGKKYKTKVALEDFTCEISEGIYALLGPNGAGKSTLMNILAGILLPSSGEILLDGKNIDELGKDYRAILGYLPQEPGFYGSFTGEQILKYFAELKEVSNSKIIIDGLLEKVNLMGDRNRKYREYSGGMKRRLGIAVTLLNDPKIIIFDEPTAGLDPKERVRFRELVSELGKDKIIIIATHIVSDVESIYDKVLLLKDGKLILNAFPEDLADDSLESIYLKNFDEDKEQ